MKFGRKELVDGDEDKRRRKKREWIPHAIRNTPYAICSCVLLRTPVSSWKHAATRKMYHEAGKAGKKRTGRGRIVDMR